MNITIVLCANKFIILFVRTILNFCFYDRIKIQRVKFTFYKGICSKIFYDSEYFNSFIIIFIWEIKILMISTFIQFFTLIHFLYLLYWKSFFYSPSISCGNNLLTITIAFQKSISLFAQRKKKINSFLNDVLATLLCGSLDKSQKISPQFIER